MEARQARASLRLAIGATALNGANRIDFGFHEPFCANKSRDLNKCTGGLDITKVCAVRFRGRFPVRNVGEHNARPQHVSFRAAKVFYGNNTRLQTCHRLSIGVAQFDGRAIRGDRSGALNSNHIVDSGCARKADRLFQRRPAIHMCSHHPRRLVDAIAPSNPSVSVLKQSRIGRVDLASVSRLRARSNSRLARRVG